MFKPGDKVFVDLSNGCPCGCTRTRSYEGVVVDVTKRGIRVSSTQYTKPITEMLSTVSLIKE